MSVYHEIKFTDADVVDADSEWIPKGESNPHNVRPWLLHDHGFCLCIVFADCLQNAIDAAVDAGKLERFLISDEELQTDYNGPEDESISYLGNNGTPHDIEGLSWIELPNPPRPSFCHVFDDYLGRRVKRKTE